MFDERAFIVRVESANVDELTRLLAHPAAQEENALRVHLGDARYQSLHGMALKRGVTRGVRKPKGNVVVIPGIMGSALASVNRAGTREDVWANALRIINGWLDRLRLGDDGRTEYNPDFDVRATGIMKRHYGELLMTLSQNWNVRAFWYDWRKDVRLAAAELGAQISGWFDEDAPVHLVAHSMGGLVARAFIKTHPERWKAMWDKQSMRKGASGGRLIMLGTPNHGSFNAVRLITGLDGTFRLLAQLDLRHGRAELQRIANSFPAIYQLLPSPLAIAVMEVLYKTETYGDIYVPQRHLDNARRHHEWLSDVIDLGRMIYVAGYGQPTFTRIADINNIVVDDAYDLTLDGDGTVSHSLGLLKTSDGQKIPTYFIEENHGNLTASERILVTIDRLLETGTADGLSSTVPSRREMSSEDDANILEARNLLDRAQLEDEGRVQTLVRRLATRSAERQPAAFFTHDERKLEEILTRGFLSYRDEEQPRDRREVPFETGRIEIGLAYGSIADLDSLPLDGEPVDAIAVGHYVGVKPQAAERALDEAISMELARRSDRPGPLRESDLVITQYSERGIIQGELGQPFFLTDPRIAHPENGGPSDRVIAIAGMGVPGRFGVPEVTVLARELCWALGRMGKRHLATVLIGAGNGNLPVREAVDGWIRGIKHAITGSKQDEGRTLWRVTFVETDPRKVERIQEAILDQRRRLGEKDRLHITYDEFSKSKLDELREAALERERQELEAEWKRKATVTEESREDIPVRITVGLQGKTYRFGAITRTASVPEREIPLDPALVMRANDELAAEWNPLLQLERGRFLERLLLPADLRAQLATSAPVVMLLDAATARVHWEIVAQSDLPEPAGTLTSRTATSDRDGDVRLRYFLGTSRGFTRQLRTTFAPPPEPPPPPRRILRVLVVADPAEDDHLPGAEQEGVEVADRLESFNSEAERSSENRIEVVRLFGPREATRTNVLRHLMLRFYDALHFAGHCVYDREDPSSSGWIFTGRERLSANELKRIDRIPKFVFSNACESGITPDRSEMRSVDLAPSFAEAFFARGISNFVCTAWPVDDVAARQFALTLYAHLLGLGSGRQPEPMHVAMREARLAIADTPYGGRTWGAYQHYGNPYFRFFDPGTPEHVPTGGSRDRADSDG